MGSAPVRRDMPTRIASSVRRGANVSPGTSGVGRVARASSPGPAAGPGIQVWEQTDEPLEAAVHDFWWMS